METNTKPYQNYVHKFKFVLTLASIEVWQNGLLDTLMYVSRYMYIYIGSKILKQLNKLLGYH